MSENCEKVRKRPKTSEFFPAAAATAHSAAAAAAAATAAAPRPPKGTNIDFDRSFGGKSIAIDLRFAIDFFNRVLIFWDVLEINRGSL